MILRPSLALVFLAVACSATPAPSAPVTSTETGADGVSTSDADGTTSGTTTMAEGSTGGEPGCPEPADERYRDPLELLGRAEGDFFIEILDVVADGTTVYACTATQGLTIWNASNAAGPKLLIERVGPPGWVHFQYPRCQHIAIDAAGDRAVITNRGDEVQPTPWLYLYDISNPNDPVPLRGWSGGPSIEGVAIDGDRIYAAAHSDGVLVFEDHGGTDLELVGSFADDDSDAWLPVLDGQHLVVAEGATGLRTYDVGGSAPALLATVPLEGSSQDVIVDGNTAFIAASLGIAAVDVGTPAAPVVLSEKPTLGTALALTKGKDETVIVAEWGEVRAYDVSDPTAMDEVAAEQIIAEALIFSRVLTVDAVPETGSVYFGEWTGMYSYLQVSNTNGPEVWATPGSVQFGTVEPGEFDDRVVVLRNSGNRKLRVFDTGVEQPGIEIDKDCFEVPPGSSAAVEVRFEPELEGALSGFLYFTTDDPDESLFGVHFSANIPGADIGDPAPEFNLVDLEGNTWQNADLEGKVTVLAYFATF